MKELVSSISLEVKLVYTEQDRRTYTYLKEDEEKDKEEREGGREASGILAGS